MGGGRGVGGGGGRGGVSGRGGGGRVRGEAGIGVVDINGFRQLRTSLPVSLGVLGCEGGILRLGAVAHPPVFKVGV